MTETSPIPLRPPAMTGAQSLGFWLALTALSLFIQTLFELQVMAFQQMGVHLPPHPMLFALKLAICAAVLFPVGWRLVAWRRRRWLRRHASVEMVTEYGRTLARHAEFLAATEPAQDSITKMLHDNPPPLLVRLHFWIETRRSARAIEMMRRRVVELQRDQAYVTSQLATKEA